jgi:hypothetical protein
MRYLNFGAATRAAQTGDLTQIYELPTGHLSGFINRYGVPPFEPEQHVYPTVFVTGTPLFDVSRRRCHAS